MPVFEVHTTISKPVEVVYQAFIDPDNMLKWTKYLVKFEIIKGGFGEPGALAHLHYNQNGRTYIMEDRLEYLDPCKKIISQVSGNGLFARVETTFISIGDKTEINLKWDGRGDKLILKILLPLLRNKIKKGAQAEIEKFKALVEEYDTTFK